MIEGSEKQQYRRLWDYPHALMQRNPGSYVRVKTTRMVESDPNVFYGFFVAYEAQIRGFKEGCRLVVGLDGAFLKTAAGGVILSAVSRDGNNMMFPVAMAVCTSESKDTWTWFLQCFIEAVGDEMKDRLVIISDRQKGLVEAVAQLLPASTHRYCVRHIYANFCKQGFTSRILKGLLWRISSSTTVPDYECAMKDLEKENSQAFKWVNDIDKKNWVKAFFPMNVSCDLSCNNICESFNSFLLEARDKPIVTLLEMSRRLLMNRFYKKSLQAQEWEDGLCPRIRRRVTTLEKKSTQTCQVFCSGAGEYEVRKKGWHYTVSIPKKTCDCNKWQLTGIPCGHAMVCLIKGRVAFETVIADCYKKEAYMRCYGGRIHPMPDSRFWPNSGCDEILPPPFKKGPGRKKKRRVAKHELKNKYTMRRVGQIQKCGNCLQPGHKRNTCPNPTKTDGRKNQRRATAVTKKAAEGASVLQEAGPETTSVNRKKMTPKRKRASVTEATDVS